jgi:hypothetical protein
MSPLRSDPRLPVARPPAPLTAPPPGFFRLTRWRPSSNRAARACREREAERLFLQGIRTVEVRMLTRVALYREGVESISYEGQRSRHTETRHARA